MKKRCVLVGGAGFLGINTALGLLGSGFDVAVVDKRPLIDDYFSKFKKGFLFYRVDYRNSEIMKDILQKGDTLFHFAYSTLPGTPLDKMDEDIKENVFESVRLFNLAIRGGVNKIVFPSSGGTVYGESLNLPINEQTATNPICSYGITKLMIEKYILFLNRIYGIDYLVFRIGNCYGWGQNIHSEQGLIVNILAKIIKNLPITVFGDDQMVRDYIYVDDIVSAFTLSMETNMRNDIYNIGTGKGYSIKEIIGLIASLTGITPEIAYSNKRQIDVRANILDSSKMHSVSGWKARVPIEEGISKTIAWVKSAIK